MGQTIEAYQKYVRQTPQKLRLVADMVRDLPVAKAVTQLSFSNRRAAKALLKVINQAKANAVKNSKLKEEWLKLKEIQVMEGPTFKRWKPVSRGRPHQILKRSSHIKVVLEAIEVVPELKTSQKKEKRQKKISKSKGSKRS